MHNVVIFGRTGQLGTELARVFEQRGWNVISFRRADADVTNSRQVDKVFARLKPTLVLNATAYNAVDRAESEPAAAYETNALAVRNLVVACRKAGAQFVHYSTDYVFDGRANRSYTENDAVGPLNSYAVSKLAGEHYARAYLESSLIIRTSGVFGPGGAINGRGNFIETMLARAASGATIRVVNDHTASPTYAPALAERTLALVERQLTGLFHIGGGTAITWFDYARLIFKAASIKADLQPTNEREYPTPARRPKFSALSNTKMESFGIEPMPALASTIQRYLQQRKSTAQLEPAGVAK